MSDFSVTDQDAMQVLLTGTTQVLVPLGPRAAMLTPNHTLTLAKAAGARRAKAGGSDVAGLAVSSSAPTNVETTDSTSVFESTSANAQADDLRNSSARVPTTVPTSAAASAPQFESATATPTPPRSSTLGDRLNVAVDRNIYARIEAEALKVGFTYRVLPVQRFANGPAFGPLLGSKQPRVSAGSERAPAAASRHVGLLNSAGETILSVHGNCRVKDRLERMSVRGDRSIFLQPEALAASLWREQKHARI
eukprot:6190918-Pleurochrysis_carterae.AAC.2